MANFLNSQIFLDSSPTPYWNYSIKLQSDPYLQGGGLHELKNDGYLNIHADFLIYILHLNWIDD